MNHLFQRTQSHYSLCIEIYVSVRAIQMSETVSSFNTQKPKRSHRVGYHGASHQRCSGRGLWTLKEARQGWMGTGKGDDAGVGCGQAGSTKLPVQREAGIQICDKRELTNPLILRGRQLACLWHALVNGSC